MSFALTVYIQHLNNTKQLVELEMRCDKLEVKIQAQYERIDAIKFDKAVCEATMTQFTSIQYIGPYRVTILMWTSVISNTYA